MFDLCSKICTALKPQCGINFVRKIFRILEKFLKYNLWKHKNNSIEQYIRETNRNNKQLTSKKYAAQTSDFGCNEQQLTSILTQSDRSNRKCLILEISLGAIPRGFESHPLRQAIMRFPFFEGNRIFAFSEPVLSTLRRELALPFIPAKQRSYPSRVAPPAASALLSWPVPKKSWN